MITEPDWKGHESNPHGRVHIGKHTIVREGVIINKPTGKCTHIGDDCYIMNRAFIGHDCHLDDGVQINPGASIAGFVKIGKYSHIGMNASIHQNSELGEYCVLGASSFFKGMSPDGIVWAGVPSRPIKVNMIGIERSNLTALERIDLIERAIRFIDGFKRSSDIEGISD